MQTTRRPCKSRVVREQRRTRGPLLTPKRYWKKLQSRLLRKTIPVARRVLGGNDEITLHLRNLDRMQALTRTRDATLDDLREAVTTLVETERTARRVMGGAHPLVAIRFNTSRMARAASPRLRGVPGGARRSPPDRTNPPTRPTTPTRPTGSPAKARRRATGRQQAFFFFGCNIITDELGAAGAVPKPIVVVSFGFSGSFARASSCSRSSPSRRRSSRTVHPRRT